MEWINALLNPVKVAALLITVFIAGAAFEIFVSGSSARERVTGLGLCFASLIGGALILIRIS